MIKSHRDTEIEFRRLQDKLGKLEKDVNNVAVETRRNTSKGNQNRGSQTFGDQIVGGSGDTDVIVGGDGDAPLPDVGSRTISLALPVYKEMGGVTYFSLTATLSSAMGDDTSSYLWFYQQRLPDHSIEYPRKEFRHEYNKAFLTATTDWWPLADVGRFAVVSFVPVNADGKGGPELVSNEVALDPNPGVDPNPIPGTGTTTVPAGTILTISVIYENRGGVIYYRVVTALSVAANAANFGSYNFWFIIWDNAAGTSTSMLWTHLANNPNIGSYQAYGDWQPLSDISKYIQTQCWVLNGLDQVGAALYSPIVSLNPNPGIDGSKLNPISIGSGLGLDSNNEKLIASYKGIKNPDFEVAALPAPNFVIKDWENYGSSTWTLVGVAGGAYLGQAAKCTTVIGAVSGLTQMVPIDEGKAYRFVVMMKTTHIGVQVEAHYFNAAGDVYHGGAGCYPASNTVSDNLWHVYTVLLPPAPVGAGKAYLRVYTTDTPITEVYNYYLDHASFVNIEYIDNDSVERDLALDQLRIKAQGVSSARLRDLNVIFQKLGTGSVKDAVIGVDGISNAAYFQDGVLSRHGIFAVGVIQTAHIENLNCDKLNAGDITGCSLTLNLLGYISTIKNGYDGVFGDYAGLKVYKDTSPYYQRTIVTAGGVAGMNPSNLTMWTAYWDKVAGGGLLTVYNASGANPCHVDGRNGRITAYNGFSINNVSNVQYAFLQADSSGSIFQMWGASGSFINITLDGRNGNISTTGKVWGPDVRATRFRDQNDVQVLGIQQYGIANSIQTLADISGKLNDLLAKLRNHGIIAATPV